MSLFMSLDCPYCATKRAAFIVHHISITGKTPDPISSTMPSNYDFDAAGSCRLCGRLVLASFKGPCSVPPSTSQAAGDLCGEPSFYGRITKFHLISQAPEPSKPNAPEHLPPPVLRAYLDAEKAFVQGIWNLAAGGYRKAVDRAITPLLGNGAKGKMLGPKIGLLENSNLLPPAMLDWIRIVKDDGNFALHDDDQDFNLREDVEPAREFAFTLLTYLYTLPEKVRIARGLPPEGSESPPSN